MKAEFTEDKTLGDQNSEKVIKKRRSPYNCGANLRDKDGNYTKKIRIANEIFENAFGR